MTICDRLNAEAEARENDGTELCHLLWEAAEYIRKIETESYNDNFNIACERIDNAQRQARMFA